MRGLKEKTKKYLNFLLILSSFLIFTPNLGSSWYAETSEIFELNSNPAFSTHHWLAIEAINLFSDAEIQWISNNYLSFWQGIESSFNAEASTLQGLDSNKYGDIANYVLFLDGLGTSVTNDSLAIRAEEEYSKLVQELRNIDTNYTLAAFYAGALSHYVSQAGVWGAIWDESLWGTLSYENWTNFELAIERGNTISNLPEIAVNFRFVDFENISNDYFDLSPSIVTAADAYNATINLAKTIHPIAQGLGDNFNSSILHANQWSGSYYSDVEICLEASVEAIYSCIKNAIIESNLHTINSPVPDFTYYDSSGEIEISEFEVTFSDNTSTFILTDENATKAEFYYIYYDQSSLIITMSDDNNFLYYNNVTEKWYYPKSLSRGLAYNNTHSLLYCFQTSNSSITWSNLTSKTFHLNFLNLTFPSFNYEYDSNTFSLNITDATPKFVNIPSHIIVNDSTVNLAEWELFHGSADHQYPSYIFGVPARDTQGNLTRGQLYFDNQTNTWLATNVDIGWVLTTESIECFVVIKFNLTEYPIKTEYETPYSIYYFDYARHVGNYLFKTRNHVLYSTKPLIHYFEERNTLGASGITASQDYKNMALDYYQIFEKEIYGYDVRQAKWQLFYFDGAPTVYLGDLEWDNNTNTWFISEFDVSRLGGHQYYFRCRFKTMNSDTNTVFWGPLSDMVEIKMGFSLNNLYFMLIIIPIAAFFIYGYVKKNRL